MSDINEMFDSAINEVSLYRPDSDKKEGNDVWIPFNKGDYYGHIVNVDSRIVDVQGQYRARVYNYAIKVAPKNEHLNYAWQNDNGDMKETSGKEYVGRTIWAKGVFRFLEPGDKDTFESNAEGNKSYFYFCQAIGLNCKDVTKTIDGEEVTFKELPNLTTQHMEGQPVIAVCDYGKAYTNKDGKEVTPFQVKWVKEWPKGRILENDESIPF
tara:strand:- start:9160 stop:9792 length:633 start_codon:yes stop_codon:yes gene_type:complete